jgi:hypothetical protein
MSSKRRTKGTTDPSSISNIQFNESTGAQKQMQAVLPVPKAIEVTSTTTTHFLGGTATYVGKGIMLQLAAAGYTLEDSTGLYKSVIVPAGLAPVGSVVNTGPYDTITAAGAMLIEDDSTIESPIYP